MTTIVVNSIPEVAKRLRASERFVENEIARGELKAIKVGRLTRIQEGDLADYLASRPVAGNRSRQGTTN